MKIIAIETVFIFILSLIAAIVFILFFSNIRNIIINLFQQKQPKEDFEIEIVLKNNFSKDFLIELGLMCAEKAEKSKLKIENFACHYLFSDQKFENLKIEEKIEINNIKINFMFFDNKNKNAIVIYNKKNKEVFFIN